MLLYLKTLITEYPLKITIAISQQKNKELHGKGLCIINDIITRIGGNILIKDSVENYEFFVYIQIPIES